MPTPADSAENLCRVGGIGGLKPTLQPPYESPDFRLRGNDESIRTETCNRVIPTNLHHVIPTKVGIRNVKSRETVLPDKFLRRQVWIPACAGMTAVVAGRDVGWA
ncbi:hypothetical protein [Neisseria polysaccharea]|uniref:hypothetical protein n=1 Tax=Neisseria polysaccharea TaxID=489 RepID=UPI0027E0FF85|nr:hypothetical protein [Neisseria polysaccharea]